jgi:hypothetical protein
MAQQTTPAFGGQYGRRIKVYGVSPRELQQIANGGGYIVWTFLGIALGASLTAFGALVSGTAFEPVTLLVLTAIAISGGFLAVLTFVLAVREQIRVGWVIREIRRDPERLLADVGVVMHLAEAGAPVPAEPYNSATAETAEAPPLAPGRRRATPPV